MYVSLLAQISHERRQCERYLGIRCVEEFLQQQEEAIKNFYDEFMGITLADEKNDCLNDFFGQLYSLMENSNWTGNCLITFLRLILQQFVIQMY